MNKTFPTRVAIEEPARTELVGMLNTALASAVDLQSQIKQAHWNIKGPHFFARHQLFDDIAAHAREWADELAERVSTLGGYATGTARDAAAHSKLPTYDMNAVDGIDHLRVVVERIAGFCKMSRAGVAMADRLEEAITEDLCVSITRQAELDLWFLESHINN